VEVELEKQAAPGRVICVVTSIIYLLLFADCALPPSGPAGLMAQGINTVLSSIVLFIGSMVASALLYACGCRRMLHWVPQGLLLAWVLFFAPGFIAEFIPKPYYWGGVMFQNRSASDIWVENEGLVEGGNKNGYTGGSGVNWGNSPDSITVVWWYGISRFPPFDKSQINRMVLRPSGKHPRGTFLTVTIDESGQWSVDESSHARKMNNQNERGPSKNYPRD
jgi:hypothetical protein